VHEGLVYQLAHTRFTIAPVGHTRARAPCSFTRFQEKTESVENGALKYPLYGTGCRKGDLAMRDSQVRQDMASSM
jgi:hypothetical protein